MVQREGYICRISCVPRCLLFTYLTIVGVEMCLTILAGQGARSREQVVVTLGVVLFSHQRLSEEAVERKGEYLRVPLS